MDRNFREEMMAPLLLQQHVERVVVFRALQLGDMLCAVPALRALRAALPLAHIVLVGLPWAGQFTDRFRNYIDDFHSFPGHPAFPEQPFRESESADFYRAMQAGKFTLAIQMHGSGEISNSIVQGFGAQRCAGYATQQVHNDDAVCWFPYPEQGPEPLRLLDLMALLGAPAAGTHLEFPLNQRDWDELQRSGLADGLMPGSYLCIHPGARFRDKCWPPQRFAAVADRLAREYKLQVVLTGSAKEVDLANAVAAHMCMPAINTASPLSIGAMAALMSGARVLICNDTGVSHIAAGLHLQSVVIFNNADMERWAPLNCQSHRCIQDPAGARADEVLEAARALLSMA